jgi:predicted Zn-dependent protease
MDKANNATTTAELDGYVTMLLERFQAASEIYTIHSGIALIEKVELLSGLMERYDKLDETEKTAVLDKVLELRAYVYGGQFARSQYTTDGFETALEAVESEKVAEALAAINNYLTPEKYNYAGAPEALELHLAVLSLNVDEGSDYAALDKTATGGKNRKTAVFYDLNKNKPAEGYDLLTLTIYFNDMVATRLVTEESMDLVNDAKTIEDLNGISFVTMLLDRFESVNYETHSDIPVTEKIATLEDLVGRYETLGEEGKAAVLTKLIEIRNNNPDQQFARSQHTTDALAAALTEVEKNINSRLAITSVSVADKKAYESTAAGGGTVRVLGYGVVINLDADGSGKKVEDTEIIVIELYNGETLLGRQTLNQTGHDNHKDSSVISGTIDVAGEYVATSWEHEWFGEITDIPDKAVAIVKYIDGTATVEKAVGLSENATKVFFAADAVHALFENVFAEELVLAADVTQEDINSAKALVEAVTVRPDENKAVLQGLITKALELLNSEEETEEEAAAVMMQVAPIMDEEESLETEIAIEEAVENEEVNEEEITEETTVRTDETKCNEDEEVIEEE